MDVGWVSDQMNEEWMGEWMETGFYYWPHHESPDHSVLLLVYIISK